MKFARQSSVVFALILVAQQARALTAFGDLGRYGDVNSEIPSNTPEDDDYQQRQIQQWQIAVQVPPNVAQGGPGNSPPPGSVWIQVPTGGGYPQQPTGYPPQGGGYPQQPGGYPQQPGGSPQQSGTYPQQPGGNTQQPTGGYPQQPAGSYPQQPTGGYPQQPSGSYPQQPTGGYPQQPTGGYPQQPAGSYPQQPTGGYPQQPTGGYPQQPTGGYPQQPTGGYPQQPTGGYPQQPSGGYPQQPAGSYPQKPTGGYPQQPTGGYPQQPSGGYPQKPSPEVPTGGYNPPKPVGANTQQPSGGYPQKPTGQYPQQPSGGYPQQPSGGYPQQPSGGYPQQPSGGYPQQPSGGYPQQPSGGYPQQPSGGQFESTPAPFPAPGPGPIPSNELNPGQETGSNAGAALVELRKFCLSPRGQFPIDRSCSKFVNCWDDVAIESDCPGGLVFSPAGFCDYPYNVDCGNRLTDQPPPVSEKGLCPGPYGAYRAADSCSGFIVCVTGTPYKFQCPDGLHYNDELGVCDYPYNVDCRGTPIGLPAVTQETTATPYPTTGINPSNETNIYRGTYDTWLKRIPASYTQRRYKRLVKKD